MQELAWLSQLVACLAFSAGSWPVCDLSGRSPVCPCSPAGCSPLRKTSISYIEESTSCGKKNHVYQIKLPEGLT